MSMSSALNNALTGLTASARTAEVVSSNLSNALTDGYGRRSVSLSSVQVGDMGGGVRVDAINRFVDVGLLADRRLADASLSGQELSAGMLVRLQQSLGGPDDAAGLVMRLAEFEGALISASSDPASQTRLTNVVTRLQDVVVTFQNNTKSIQSLRQEADATISRGVEVVNRALQQLQELNEDILRISGGGNDVSALLDARQRAVDQIAELIPVREIQHQNGTIGLTTTNGYSLLDSKAAVLSFSPTPTITADMTMSSGALGSLFINGDQIDPVAGSGRLGGGAIGAAFTLRDTTLVEVQAGLDTLAADLISRFQDASNDPTLSAGDLGLLTDEGGTLDLNDLAGLAGRISVNPSVLATGGGDPGLVRDGLNAVIVGPAGNTAQLNRWIAALGDARADVSGSALQSAAGRAAAFSSDLGATRLDADEKLSFTMARWETLREAELADGVDTDIELQTLLRVEQSYAANAKVIQTVDFMIQRLLEI